MLGKSLLLVMIICLALMISVQSVTAETLYDYFSKLFQPSQSSLGSFINWIIGNQIAATVCDQNTACSTPGLYGCPSCSGFPACSNSKKCCKPEGYVCGENLVFHDDWCCSGKCVITWNGYQCNAWTPTTTTTTSTPSCQTCSIKTPYINPSSPTENTNFEIICPTTYLTTECKLGKECGGITAYTNIKSCNLGYQWTTDGIKFTCLGHPAGTYTAYCNVASGGTCWNGLKTCGESPTSKSFTVQSTTSITSTTVYTTTITSGTSTITSTVTSAPPGKCSGSVSVNLASREFQVGTPVTGTMTYTYDLGNQFTCTNNVCAYGTYEIRLFAVDCGSGKKSSSTPLVVAPYSFTYQHTTYTNTVQFTPPNDFSNLLGNPTILNDPSNVGKCYGIDFAMCTTPFNTNDPCYVTTSKPTNEVWSDCAWQGANKNTGISYCDADASNGLTSSEFKLTAPTSTSTSTTSATTGTTGTTTTTPSTSTTTGTVTTTPSVSTSTTTPTPGKLIINCNECNIKSTCECSLQASCDEGLWIVRNKEDTPLSLPVVDTIPPTKVEFEPNVTGKVEVTVVCTKPTYSPPTNKTIVEVKEEFLKCDSSCETFKDCTCRVIGCEDGRFQAFLGGTVLKNEKITSTSYTATFNSDKVGTVEASVDCNKPVKSADARIPMTGTGTTTTTIPVGRFTGNVFVCSPISTGYRCSLGYNNNYGTAYLEFFFSMPSGEIVSYTDAIPVDQGTGTKSTDFSCSGKQGRYMVSWTAFTDPDATNPIPGAWPKPEERQTITC